MDLPNLSAEPTSPPECYSDCCLALSDQLIQSIALLLPKKPQFTLSVGSGSGLLEALLMQRQPNVTIEGVEVNQTVNRHIPAENMNVVGGTWDLCSRASDAGAWMFVYPRAPKLISRYLQLYGNGAVKTIYWLGPRADWPDFEPCFRTTLLDHFEILEELEIAPYEQIVVIKKKQN